MNIFVLDLDHKKNARAHCDKHAVKMLLEYTQLLCTAIDSTGVAAPYRPTHKNHPCAIWARESVDNWLWLQALTLALGEEYTHRYGKAHKSARIAAGLEAPALPQLGLTPFALAMPDQFRSEDTVQAYRDYYTGDKAYMCKWKNRMTPSWFVEVGA